MAKDYSFAGFQNSGFAQASNISALQEYIASNYNRTDEELRADAQAAYESEYSAKKLAYQNQIDQLGVYRDADIKKINTSYDQQGNAIQRDLSGRGLGRSSLVSTRGVENENARNAAISDKSLEYLGKEEAIHAEMQGLDAEYAQNVENKYVELRNNQINNRANLMLQIAQLQQSGYSAYVNYQNRR